MVIKLNGNLVFSSFSQFFPPSFSLLWYIIDILEIGSLYSLLAYCPVVLGIQPEPLRAKSEVPPS